MSKTHDLEFAKKIKMIMVVDTSLHPLQILGLRKTRTTIAEYNYFIATLMIAINDLSYSY